MRVILAVEDFRGIIRDIREVKVTVRTFWHSRKLLMAFFALGQYIYFSRRAVLYSVRWKKGWWKANVKLVKSLTDGTKRISKKFSIESWSFFSFFFCLWSCSLENRLQYIQWPSIKTASPAGLILIIVWERTGVSWLMRWFGRMRLRTRLSWKNAENVHDESDGPLDTIIYGCFLVSGGCWYWRLLYLVCLKKFRMCILFSD